MYQFLSQPQNINLKSKYTSINAYFFISLRQFLQVYLYIVLEKSGGKAWQHPQFWRYYCSVAFLIKCDNYGTQKFVQHESDYYSNFYLYLEPIYIDISFEFERSNKLIYLYNETNLTPVHYYTQCPLQAAKLIMSRLDQSEVYCILDGAESGRDVHIKSSVNSLMVNIKGNQRSL